MKLKTIDILYTIKILFFSFIILNSFSIFAGDKINPYDFMPKDCVDSGKGCGLIPENPVSYRSIPLSESNFIMHRGLPSRVDLSNNMPPVGSQGQQGSCVGWASTYALKSYQEKVERNWSYDFDPDRKTGEASTIFSPAFTYNQINGGVDRGSSISEALDLIVKKGAIPWKYMPYSDRDYRTQPSQSVLKIASRYKGESYKRLNQNNIQSLKSELAAGNPIIGGFLVDNNLKDFKKGKFLDTIGILTGGGHAMTIVGYDDSQTSPNGHRGAFKIINSWSKWWGENGYGWISYRHFPERAKYLYVLKDRQDSKPEPEKQEEEIRPPLQVNASQGTYSDRIVLNWTSVKEAVGYEIYRANPESKDSFHKIGESTSTSYEDSGISPGLGYFYRIVAVTEKGQSSVLNLSPVAEGFSKEDKPLPSSLKVLNLVLSLEKRAGKTYVRLNWDTLPSASYYLVYKYEHANKRWKYNKSRIKDTYLYDSSIQAGMKYSYVVISNLGKEYSDPAQIFIPTETAPPSKVVNLNASKGTFGDKIALAWLASTGANTYYIYRFNPDSRQWKLLGKTDREGFIDDSFDIRNGREFYYSIIASNPHGYAPYSNYDKGYVNPYAKRGQQSLLPPDNFFLKKGDKTKFTLYWKEVKGAEAYNIFRKKLNDNVYTFIASVKASETSYSGEIPTGDGSLYLYSVRSFAVLRGESNGTNALAHSYKDKTYITNHRVFLPKKLNPEWKGKWKNHYWDEKGNLNEANIVISEKKDGFRAVLFINGKKVKTFPGSIVPGANFLVSKGFKMEFNNTESGLSQVEIKESKIFNYDFTEAFIKSNE